MEPGAAAPASPTQAPADKPAEARPAESKVHKAFEDLKTKGRAAPTGNIPDNKAAPANGADKDPDFVAVQRLLAEDARNKTEAKRLREERIAWESERARSKTEMDAAVTARQAREKGDVISMLKALGMSEQEIYEGDDALFFKLAEARAKKPEIDQKTQLATMLEQKLSEREAAQAKVAEEAKVKTADEQRQAQEAMLANVQAAKDTYSKNVAAIAHAGTDKYPTLIALGIPVTAVTDYAWNVIVNSQGRESLSADDALADLEKHYAEKIGKLRPAPEPKKYVSAISVNPGWQAQDGAPGREAAKDLKSKFEALKQRARQQPR